MTTTTPQQLDMNEKEFEFLKFYMEQTWEENRHLENLRERVTILVITLASAIIGFIVQQKFAAETKIFNFIVILLGVFGFIMTLKIFQIHQKGQRRLDKWYEYLNSYCGTNPQILTLRNQADNENKSEFSVVSKIRHNYFWTILNISVALIGVSLFFFKPTQQKENKNETQNVNLIIKSVERTDTLKIKQDTLKIINK
jgi:hypothetical protein